MDRGDVATGRRLELLELLLEGRNLKHELFRAPLLLLGLLALLLASTVATVTPACRSHAIGVPISLSLCS